MQNIVMRKTIRATLLVGLFIVGLSVLLPTGSVLSQETLTITRDQFEFRDAPQVGEDTLIGTLRLGTPVEWTGKTSGHWFEIKAPNGQTGWVHGSGLSRPTTRIEPTRAPTPKPSRAATSRSTTSAPGNASLKKLKKANEQYKAQLQEKDRRITELSDELGALEGKLTDVAQMVDDHKQLLKLEEIKGTEAQNEIAALQETLKQKDEDALAQKVEMTKLQNQLKDFQSRQNGFSWERILLIISLLFNLLALLLLLDLFKTRRRFKTHLEHDATHGDTLQPIRANAPAENQQQETIAAPPDVVPIQISHETDPHLDELDVIMDASEKDSAPHTPPEETSSYVEEDVVIDLEDVLPATQEIPEPSPSVEIEKPDKTISPEESEQQELDDVIIVEEPIQQLEASEQLQDDLPKPPTAAATAPLLISSPAKPEPSRSDDEIVQTIVEEAELAVELEPEEAEIPAELQVEETAEPEQYILSEEPETAIELEPEKPDLSTETSLGEMVEREPEALEESESMETLLKDTPELDQQATLDEILDDGDLEDLETTPTEEAYQAIKVGGDTFEVLPKRNTQLIESEDELPNDALSEMSKITSENLAGDDDEEVFMMNPGIIEDVESVEEAAFPGEAFESDVDQAVRNFEPGTDIASTPIEMDIPETSQNEDLLKEKELGAEIIQKEDLDEETSRTKRTAPSLFEPSPIVIEPENVPEEQLETPELEPQQSTEPKYDIELVKVGKNPDYILHILSKIEGLTKSPQALVENAPCIIAKGAGRTDAENFQLVMKKFGSDVRLIER